MSIRDDEAGVSAVFQFLIAGAIMTALIGTVLTSSQQLGEDARSQDAVVSDERSDDLLDVALSRSWSWSEASQSMPEGLAGPETGSLQISSLVQLHAASWDVDANDKRFGYDEARAAWGMSEREGFHLRIEPLTASGLYDISDLEVAYVGDWTPPAEIHVDYGTDEEIMIAAQAALNTSMGAATEVERQMLRSLGTQYHDRIHLTAAAPTLLVDVTFAGKYVVSTALVNVLSDLTLMEGDVYYDDPDSLGTILGHRLAGYDVLVIGAGVDPDALLHAGLENQIRNHVRDGGLLVAMGGQDDTSWLDPLISISLDTANQGLGVPDLNHPLLRWPGSVDWQAMGTDEPWSEGALPDDRFQHILLDDGVTLAVSNAGALEDGMAIFYGLDLDADAELGTQALLNALAYYARQDLHLDFGEHIPKDQPIATSERTLWADDDGDNQVPLRARLYYWYY